MHNHVLRLSKRVGIAIAGGLVMMVGAALLVLPGPGVVVIVLGLAILSLEFERPRDWLARLKVKGVQLKHRIRERRSPGHDGP
jgi:hypothetical protein